MKKITMGLLSVACAFGLVSTAAAQLPQLNEVVVNDSGADDQEFVEICGDPGTDLTRFTVVVIEGEGGGQGLIDRAFNLTGIVGASGFYVLGDAAVSPDQIKGDTIENGGETILLVQQFSGNVGDDLDADNDGVADGPFPGTIIDGIGLGRPSQGDAVYYGVPALGPDTGNDGTADFDVAAAARCTDCSGAWGIVCLAGSEGDQVCDLAQYIASGATPGSANSCGVISVEETSWGSVKGLYR